MEYESGDVDITGYGLHYSCKLIDQSLWIMPILVVQCAEGQWTEGRVIGDDERCTANGTRQWNSVICYLISVYLLLDIRTGLRHTVHRSGILSFKSSCGNVNIKTEHIDSGKAIKYQKAKNHRPSSKSD